MGKVEQQELTKAFNNLPVLANAASSRTERFCKTNMMISLGSAVSSITSGQKVERTKLRSMHSAEVTCTRMALCKGLVVAKPYAALLRITSNPCALRLWFKANATRCTNSPCRRRCDLPPLARLTSAHSLPTSPEGVGKSTIVTSLIKESFVAHVRCTLNDRPSVRSNPR